MERSRQIEKTVLDNGLTVISETNKHFYTISVGEWIKTGVVNETLENNGITHFIEHMNFKGTPTRNYEQISSFLESKGGQLNAYTAKEVTCYYARLLPEHLSDSINLLLDITLNSNFPKEEIAKEKQIILEEIRDVEDNPAELSADLFYQDFFQTNHLGLPILGEEKNIMNFTRDSLLEYVRDYYTPENIIISAAGPLEHEKLVEIVNNELKSIDSHPFKKNITPRNHPYQPSTNFHKQHISQIHTYLGIPAIPHNNEDKWPFFVLNTILGGGMSSILFQEIRERLGIAYTIYSFLDIYKNHGLWGIYFATEEKNFIKTIEQISQIIKNNIKKYITREQVKSAKNQLKGGVLIGMESITSRMKNIAKNQIYQIPLMTIDEMINTIDQVKLEEVIQIIEKYIINQTMTLTALGKTNKVSKNKFLPL